MKSKPAGGPDQEKEPTESGRWEVVVVGESKASRPGAQLLGGLSANGAHVQLASFPGFLLWSG